MMRNYNPVVGMGHDDCEEITLPPNQTFKDVALVQSGRRLLHGKSFFLLGGVPDLILDLVLDHSVLVDLRLVRQTLVRVAKMDGSSSLAQPRQELANGDDGWKSCP